MLILNENASKREVMIHEGLLLSVKVYFGFHAIRQQNEKINAQRWYGSTSKGNSLFNLIIG